MTRRTDEIEVFLATRHPYDTLSSEALRAVAAKVARLEVAADQSIYDVGDALEGVYLVASGGVEIREARGALISALGPGNSFGERGLLRDGDAVTSARASAPSVLYVLPTAEFRSLCQTQPAFQRFFDRAPARPAAPETFETLPASALMSANVVFCAPDISAAAAARMMRDHRVSCLPVVENDRLIGVLTTTDLAGRVLAQDLSGDTPVRAVMTENPVTLSPEALGSDALDLMTRRKIKHAPVTVKGRLTGIVASSDLIRHQAASSASLIRNIAAAPDVETMAVHVRRIPELLAQLVGAGQRHQTVTRRITDIADAATRRLLTLAEAELGPAPAPWLWLACGSQGRQEQTGVSDQDNCLFLGDKAAPSDDAYFAALAKFVSDGLDACGYFYCPGGMMATTARWRQPVRVWRDYFTGWVRKPDPMAQMLASVMFDLRPIAGDESLFADLHAQTLAAAARNSIFVAHMASNSLKHTPPLGLFGGLAAIRSGEHKNTLDLKMNGVAPVADLGRLYAIQGRIEPVNTRIRLAAAIEDGVISSSGGRDLLDAYDLIAETRLRHQAAQTRMGRKPDNFIAPSALSDMERSHLRDAFVVIKTMQSALGHTFSAVL